MIHDENFRVVSISIYYYLTCTWSSLHSSLITCRNICAVKCFSLYDTVKDVSLVHPHCHLINHPLFRQALFELEHSINGPKVYINTNEDFLFILIKIYTSLLLVICWVIVKMDIIVSWAWMDGLVWGYIYREEDDTEMSKTVSRWKQEYCIYYYLVSDWYKINIM